jgi:hypothetical protein
VQSRICGLATSSLQHHMQLAKVGSAATLLQQEEKN